MYASKRRQRNFKRVRDTSKRANEPSNPSKRHRERLNGELETVAGLLPYDQQVIQRLDKLSVLRLAVSYLHIKAHFQVCAHATLMHNGRCPSHPLASYAPAPPPGPSVSGAPPAPSLPQLVPSLVEPHSGMPIIDPQEPAFNALVQKALGGFVMILSESGEIYYVTENIETYLGFLQSDVLHQSVYEMIHSEDRDGLRKNLTVNSSTDIMARRSVVARFRCLLDNTCGFVRVEISGRLSQIHGTPCASTSAYAAHAAEPGRYALIAVCTPFVPPLQMDPTLDDPILKTKHSLDLSFSSLDSRLHLMLEIGETLGGLPGYGGASSSATGTFSALPGGPAASVRVPAQSFYAFVHPEDVKFVAEAHESVIKYCSSGLTIYRLLSRNSGVVHYVQSSLRLFFKNGKPETIGGNHRLLNEVDGQALLEKRNSLKFKFFSFDDTLLQSPRILQAPQPQQQQTQQLIQQQQQLQQSAFQLAKQFQSNATTSQRDQVPARVPYPDAGKEPAHVPPPFWTDPAGTGSQFGLSGAYCNYYPSPTASAGSYNQLGFNAQQFDPTLAYPRAVLGYSAAATETANSTKEKKPKKAKKSDAKQQVKKAKKGDTSSAAIVQPEMCVNSTQVEAPLPLNKVTEDPSLAVPPTAVAASSVALGLVPVNLPWSDPEKYPVDYSALYHNNAVSYPHAGAAAFYYPPADGYCHISTTAEPQLSLPAVTVMETVPVAPNFNFTLGDWTADYGGGYCSYPGVGTASALNIFSGYPTPPSTTISTAVPTVTTLATSPAVISTMTELSSLTKASPLLALPDATAMTSLANALAASGPKMDFTAMTAPNLTADPSATVHSTTHYSGYTESQAGPVLDLRYYDLNAVNGAYSYATSAPFPYSCDSIGGDGVASSTTAAAAATMAAAYAANTANFGTTASGFNFLSEVVANTLLG